MTNETNNVNAQQETASPPTVRAEIQVNGRYLDAVIADAWAAIHAADGPPTVFLQEGRLVRILKGGRGPEVIQMDRISFYGHLGRVADWVKVTPRGMVDVFPRKDVARAMLAAPDLKLPILDDVVCAPVFGADGRLLAEPGYHADDRLWHHIPLEAEAPRVPTESSPDDVAKARQLLECEFLGDFSFARASDRVHALAALLLPFARRLVDGPVPAHLVEATMPGSGRSLFVDVVSILATGALVHGGQVAAQVPEVKEFASRGRGSKRLVSGGIRIRLAPRTDRPWLRTGFRHSDLREWALAHRNQLVHAALVLVQNWLAKERPSGEARLVGFERWSEAMGGILASAGVQGFLDDTTRATLCEVDTDSNALAVLISGWEELPNGFGTRGCTIAQALEVLRGDGKEKQHSRLRAALEQLCPHPPGQLLTAQRVGYALRRLRGRVVCDRKLKTRVSAGNNLWFVDRDHAAEGS